MAKTENPNRRKFIKKSALSSMAAILGSKIVFALPDNYTPVALEQDNDPGKLFGKHKDMIVLNDKPWNVESKAHLLDDDVTPADKMFIRNNGLIPDNIDVDNWTLTIKGEAMEGEKPTPYKSLKQNSPYTPTNWFWNVGEMVEKNTFHLPRGINGL